MNIVEFLNKKTKKVEAFNFIPSEISFFNFDFFIDKIDEDTFEEPVFLNWSFNFNKGWMSYNKWKNSAHGRFESMGKDDYSKLIRTFEIRLSYSYAEEEGWGSLFIIIDKSKGAMPLFSFQQDGNNVIISYIETNEVKTVTMKNEKDAILFIDTSQKFLTEVKDLFQKIK